MISYETAVKLKEAGVEWKTEHPAECIHNKGMKCCNYKSGYASCPQCAPCPEYELSPPTDQLIPLIREKGYELIQTSQTSQCTTVNCYKVTFAGEQDYGSKINAYADTEEEAFAQCLLKIIEKEKPSIEDIINKASSSTWDNGHLLSIAWENEPLTPKEHEIFLEHFPHFKKPKTCGECRKPSPAIPQWGLFCPAHPDISHLQGIYKRRDQDDAACPNFKPKDKQC